MDEQTIITPPPQEKYTLIKKFEEELQLKIFFMTVFHVTGISINGLQNQIPIRSIGVISYSYDKAKNKAMELYGENGVNAINSREEDFTLVEDILKVLNVEGVVIQNIVPESEKPKLMPIETFKASLIMAVNEYVVDKEDKAKLGEIISKITV